MSAFGGLILTNKGRALQAKAQTGVQLNFTKVKVGDGTLSGQSILELNDLISSKKELSILELKTQLEGKASLKSFLSNSDIVTGFYWRELGIFAQDPDEGEILYCYGNAGENAEYIPAGGGADVVEKYINIVTIVGNASSVSATLGSEIYVTQADFNTHASRHASGGADELTPADIGAETPAGAQFKADTAETNAKAYTDQEVGDLAGAGRTTETVMENRGLIGTLANLLTSAKDNLVNAINEVLNSLNAHQADYASHGDVATLERTNKDVNGIFTTLTWKRPGGTKFKESVLSGGTSPQYTTRTVTYYETDGTTVKQQVVYALSYDVDGDLISEVLQ